MSLPEKIACQVRQNAVRRGAQKRLEHMLSRHRFMNNETEGCWVRPDVGARIYLDGLNWVIYLRNSLSRPAYTGEGSLELTAVIEMICG